MTAILLALVASLAWGFSGFIGGVASRSLRIAVAVVVSMLASFAVLLPVALLTGSPRFADAEAAWSVVAGLLGVSSVGLLYASMSVGMISIVGPISACGVVIPVVVGLARGEQPSTLQLVGMAVAATGVVLASLERDAEKRGARLVAGLGLALAAAGGFGLWFVAIDLASTHDPYWASAIAQLASASSAVLVWLLWRGRLAATEVGTTASADAPGSRFPGGVARSLVLFAVAAGVTDSVGVVAFAVSTSHGFLSVVSVIAALYPAFMVGFAAVFLHERPARHQYAGVVMALLGIVLITAGGA